MGSGGNCLRSRRHFRSRTGGENRCQRLINLREALLERIDSADQLGRLSQRLFEVPDANECHDGQDRRDDQEENGNQDDERHARVHVHTVRDFSRYYSIGT
jgi:hypothetical protein